VMEDLPISLKLSIISFMDAKTRNIALKDKHERLPPVQFLQNAREIIPESHVLNKKDFEELDKVGFVIKDDFLGKEKLQLAFEEANSLLSRGKLQRAGMGGSTEYWQNEKARSDYVLWLNSAFDSSFDSENIESIRDVIKQIDQIKHQLNDDINFESEKNQMHLTCYPGDGARYMRHLDAHVGASPRKITCLYYINPNWNRKMAENSEFIFLTRTKKRTTERKNL